MRYFLIGLPGVGKSTLATILADKLQLECVDLDRAISESTGRTISQLFEKGEMVFRKHESACLLDIIAEKSEVVLACGGGTPCFNNNMNVMKSNGIVVYLKADIHVVLKRLKNDTKQIRPLLTVAESAPESVEEKIQTLYENRKQYYEEADLVLDWNQPIEHRNMEIFIDKIINFTKDECKRN